MERPSDLFMLFAGCGDLVGPAVSPEVIPGELSRLVAETYPGVGFRVEAESTEGLDQLATNLESGGSRIVQDGPEIVVLSLAGEVGRLASQSAADAMVVVRDDLVSVIDLVKSEVGAHVFVANLSTLDPRNPVFNYHGLKEEPFSLRAHRLNRMLADVSRERGISVIDVDRVIAEKGGDETVEGPARYNESGLIWIAMEIFRVVEDYGFLDERPILEQVGAGHAGVADVSPRAYHVAQGFAVHRRIDAVGSEQFAAGRCQDRPPEIRNVTTIGADGHDTGRRLVEVVLQCDAITVRIPRFQQRIRRRDGTRGRLRVEPVDILEGQEHLMSFTHVVAEHEGRTLDVVMADAMRFSADGKVEEFWTLSNDQAAVDSFIG